MNHFPIVLPILIIGIMITLIFTNFVAFIIVDTILLLFVIYMFTRAPMGHEDAEGFHRDESKNKTKHN